MKLRLKKMACVLLLILPFSLLLTCAQQTDPAKMKIQELLASGKTSLGNANYDEAIQSFQLILNEYDPENPEATYGVAIASTVKQLAGMGDQFQSIIDMVFKMLPTLTTSKVPQKLTPQATSSGINAILESVLNDTLLDQINALLPLWEKLKQHPEFSMTIDKIPAQIGVAPYLVYKVDLGGVQDIGTVYFISGLAQLAKATFYLLYSVNLDLTASLPGLLQEFLPILQGTESLTIDRDFILGILAYLIDSSPNFMTLEPNAGKERLSEAADLLARAIQDLLNCLDSISAEKSVQSNHLVGYKSEGSKSYLVFNLKDEDGVPMSIPIEFSSQIKTSLQNLISSLQASGGVRASWAQDLAPFVGLIAQAAIQSGMLDPVLAFALPMIQPYLGADMVAMVNNMMGTVKELAKSGVISGAITTIIPDAIQFDFGKFTHAPPQKYLRLILPAVTTDQNEKKKLLVEYECADLAGNSLWCPYPDTITSTAHFIGTAYEIPDDGVKNSLPYLSSVDPSIGGFMFLNLSSLDPSFPNEFLPPTSYEFNYFLGKVVGGLLGGLGGLTSSPGEPAVITRPSGN
ncbi:MAG: hypothetical protein NT056_05185 [Proteobacteria bacterium]|nr:hypothetical protein [Pseudomonadota bacterium]